MPIAKGLPSTHRAVHHPYVAGTAVLLAVGRSASKKFVAPQLAVGRSASKKFVAPQLVLPGTRSSTGRGCSILALEAGTADDIDDPAAVGAPAVVGCRGLVLVEAGTAQHRPAFVAGAHGRRWSSDEG